MANLDFKDPFQQYTKYGDQIGRFNAVRQDTSSAVIQYFAYQNEAGAYIISRTTTSGGIAILVYEFYGRTDSTNFSTDWSNRASLTYGEFHALFNKQSDY